MKVIRLIAAVTALFAQPRIAVGSLSVTISESSIRINGVELRNGSQGGGGRYISLTAAENAFGRPQDIYVAGPGVRVYAWRDAGIHMQKGFRGSDKGKIFKLQVWFVDAYDKDKDKQAVRLSEHVKIDR